MRLELEKPCNGVGVETHLRDIRLEPARGSLTVPPRPRVAGEISGKMGISEELFSQRPITSRASEKAMFVSLTHRPGGNNIHALHQTVTNTSIREEQDAE